MATGQAGSGGIVGEIEVSAAEGAAPGASRRVISWVRRLQLIVRSTMGSLRASPNPAYANDVITLTAAGGGSFRFIDNGTMVTLRAPPVPGVTNLAQYTVMPHAVVRVSDYEATLTPPLGLPPGRYVFTATTSFAFDDSAQELEIVAGSRTALASFALWLVRTLRHLFIRLAGIFLQVAGGGAGGGGAAGQFYDWPTQPTGGPHRILSTFGEFRGAGGDGMTFLHGAVDIPETGNAVKVFSPDVGVLRRSGASTNPSAGGGNVRIGHFGFVHINTLYARPGATYARVGLPQDFPIRVAEPGTAYFGAPVNASPLTLPLNAPLPQRTLGRNAPAIGYRRGAAQYEGEVYWPRTLAIGEDPHPTDLHFIYYESSDGAYDDPAALSDPLEVVRYVNSDDPVARDLRLYTHAGDALAFDFDTVGSGAVLSPAAGGAKLKVAACSRFAGTCGVYELELAIAGEAPGGGWARSRVWRFHKLPSDADSRILVDTTLSEFTNVNNKITWYVLTSSRNGSIAADNHWELEDTTRWPDGEYEIRVWVKNIRESRGVGQAPDLNEVAYTARCSIQTDNARNRRVRVTRRFSR